MGRVVGKPVDSKLFTELQQGLTRSQWRRGGDSNSRYSRVHLRSNVSLWAYKPVSISITSQKAERARSRPEKHCRSRHVSTLISPVGETNHRVRSMATPRESAGLFERQARSLFRGG
jgi:hypothetical protein